MSYKKYHKLSLSSANIKINDECSEKEVPILKIGLKTKKGKEKEISIAFSCKEEMHLFFDHIEKINDFVKDAEIFITEKETKLFLSKHI